MNYKEQAENLLKKYYGDHAKFKQGQLEACLLYTSNTNYSY